MTLARIFSGTMAAALLVSCGTGSGQTDKQKEEQIMLDENDVIARVDLTVAEGKRLIARGLANYAPVRESMSDGMVVITRGSTNTYIAEELAGLDAEHGAFMTGHFVPKGEKPVSAGKKNVGEIVLVDGKVADMTYAEALERMKPGDVIFKGANLLDYSGRKAAVCVGASDGGTVYRLLPYVGEGKARLIIPVGLEKQTFGNLDDYSRMLAGNNVKANPVPRLYVYETGEIFTEIEAIRTFADVKVFPMGAGGLAGREGGISLVVAGSSNEVEKALEAVSSVQGERPFAE